MKPIKFSNHALTYINRRGFTIEEVEKAIKESKWIFNKRNKYECFLDIPFNKEWNGKIYETKQIKPIFVEEEKEIVVITVYTFYF